MFEWHIPSYLEGISWASGVELNYTKKTNVFYYVYKRFILLLVTFFTFLTFFKFLFERFLHLWCQEYD